MSTDWAATSEQKEQLFAELGRCLYVFQAIEARLKLLLPHMVPPGKEVSLTSQDFSNWRFYLDSKTTLGPLIQKLKEHIGLQKILGIEDDIEKMELMNKGNKKTK